METLNRRFSAVQRRTHRGIHQFGRRSMCRWISPCDGAYLVFQIKSSESRIFSQSLIDNPDARFTASHDIIIIMAGMAVVLSQNCLMKLVLGSQVDPIKWPSSTAPVSVEWGKGHETVWTFWSGRPSPSHHESLPVSTAVCERGLSTINVIVIKSGNRPLVKAISNMFFLSLVRVPTLSKRSSSQQSMSGNGLIAVETAMTWEDAKLLSVSSSLLSFHQLHFSQIVNAWQSRWRCH